MIIRRYTGKDAQEAILKVKMDLGSEAVIFSTKKIRQKGFLKIFNKPIVEVVAAIDEFNKNLNKTKLKTENKNTNEKEIDYEKKDQNEANFTTNFTQKEGKLVELENKVSNMEAMLKKIYDQVQVNTLPDSKREKQEVEPERKKLPKIFEMFLNNLIKNEVEANIALQIIDTTHKKSLGNTSVNDIASILYNVISCFLGKPEMLKLREDGKPTIIIFVGPTGVGKTTTLAKIAANYALNYKKSVGLITADTYRIAAVDQLKTYAEILGMPVSVIFGASEVREAINLYKDKDIILIDTAGRSSNDHQHFEEIKGLIEECAPDEIYLVLSTTTSARNCQDIIKKYGFLNDYKLIFTKLDEAPVTGMIYNVKNLTQKSLSYITTGQSVPDDIEIANIDKITKNLLGSIK